MLLLMGNYGNKLAYHVEILRYDGICNQQYQMGAVPECQEQIILGYRWI